MKTDKYVKNPKAGFFKAGCIKLMRFFFRSELAGFEEVDILRIGRGVIITNIIFKKLLRLNCESSFMVHFTSKVILPDAINIEDGEGASSVYASFATSSGCYFQAYNGINIGSGTRFGPGTKIISANHDLVDPESHVSAGPIEIGKDVWIGANTVLLPEVKIGDGAVIGAGSIVVKDVASKTVVAGNPARKISDI